ncbi:thiol:disulfide interchange protein [Streptacidiphilus sp. MAP12-20]|uniref:thioredoxin family protein n=1 Tax=Streptacidiphilus sp. MAP12-20 TaxID=3156299 RepID=UPI003511B858
MRSLLRALLLGLLPICLLAACVQVNGRAGGLAPHYARPFVALPSVTPAPVPTGYDPRADAPAAVAAAQAASRKDGRPVLVEFGADWCTDCQVLAQRSVTPGAWLVLARNYHLVTVDVGHYDRNSALAARWIDLKRSGIPALVVLEPDGRVRATTQDGSFANARALSADAITSRLVDWLYPASRS